MFVQPGDRDSDDRRQDQEMVAEALLANGWKLRQPSEKGEGPDFLAHRGKLAYAVTIKSAGEGRSDRLIPLWSQAFLEASAFSGHGYRPLAVIVASRVPPRVADRILEFAGKYASGAGAGVMDHHGLRRFRGQGLENLDAAAHLPAVAQPIERSAGDLFSDLNQWMLKLLLAPEIPEKLLSAPRRQYSTATELAKTADVSVMTATRFLKRLRSEGYLDESAPTALLVRREHLLQRWQAAAARHVREAPMRLLLRGNPVIRFRNAMKDGRACLGLFSAADELGFNFVSGVPPYIYVPRIGAFDDYKPEAFVPAQPSEVPDFILRQAPAPESVFRGMVSGPVLPVTDILQVWLDVAAHPARGMELAALIQRRLFNHTILSRS